MRRFLFVVLVVSGCAREQPPRLPTPPPVRTQAIKVPDSASDTPKTTAAALLEAIRYREFEAVTRAVSVVKQDPSCKEAVPQLITALGDSRGEVRRRAAYAAGEIGPEAKAAVPALVRVLGDHEARPTAIVAIGRIGPEAAQALLKEVREGSDVSRAAAAAALGKLGPAVVPQLVEALGSGEVRMQRAAAGALAAIGPAAKAAVPALVEALKSCDRPLRLGATDAIWRIDRQRPELIGALIGLLRDRFPAMQLQAARRLGARGADAGPAVPALVRLLGSNDDRLRVTVEEALEKIGPAAVPALTAALGNEKAEMRAGAADALGRIGPRAKAAVPALVKAREDRDPYVASHAAEALRQIERRVPTQAQRQ